MPFRLATVVSSNPLNFINAHSLHQKPLLTMRIDKVKWITAHNCGKPKWHSFTPSLSWKGKILGLDIVSQNVPLKTNYWTKIADLGIIFLRRRYLTHWYQLLYRIPHIVGSMPFRFFWATLYFGKSGG